MLYTYDDFIKYINTYKIVPFSKVLDGYPSIAELTAGKMWHTGLDDTDPWRWKDIAATQKDCAYGCFLGGKKGFIAMDFVPIAKAAFSPEKTIHDLYMQGSLAKITFDAYNMVVNAGEIAIFDLRVDMGVTKKKGASALDGALRELQQMMQICVASSRQKINKQGIPYGWRSNVYATFEKWAGHVITDDAANYDKQEAQNIIIEYIGSRFEISDNKIKKLFKL